jgi:hypothetical protein
MIDVLVQIDSLDRRNVIERRLDDLLNRYVESDFYTFDPFASIVDLLETYLAVVRRRKKLRRNLKQSVSSITEISVLGLITQTTQDEIRRRVQIAVDKLKALDDPKLKESICNLEELIKDVSVFANKDQANISTSKRGPTIMSQIVQRLYDKDGSITSTQVKALLKDMVGDGQVVAIDEEYVEIDETQPDSKVRRIKPYKLKGIPNILSRIKNPRK